MSNATCTKLNNPSTVNQKKFLDESSCWRGLFLAFKFGWPWKPGAGPRPCHENFREILDSTGFMCSTVRSALGFTTKAIINAATTSYLIRGLVRVRRYVSGRGRYTKQRGLGVAEYFNIRPRTKLRESTSRCPFDRSCRRQSLVAERSTLDCVSSIRPNAFDEAKSLRNSRRMLGGVDLFILETFSALP